MFAEKGFLIHDLLPKNVFLHLSAFLRGKTKFSKMKQFFHERVQGAVFMWRGQLRDLQTEKSQTMLVLHCCLILVNLFKFVQYF